MRMDQGLAWMLAFLLAGTGCSGFYWWANYVASEEHAKLISLGSEPTPVPSAAPQKSDHEGKPEAHVANDTHDAVTEAEKPAAAKINAALPSAWGYQGSQGPRYWSRLDPAYLDCGAARGQSPVDLDNTKLDQKLTPIIFSYRDSNLVTTLRGQELLATVSGNNYVEIEGDRFNLHSISIHTPSEHHLQSVPYELELQLNHHSPSGELAVLAIFVAAGNRSEDLELLLSSLPKGDGDEREIAAFPLMKLLPKKKTYFHYKGSMTTPPCTGNVAWYVFTTSLEAASRDIERAVRLVINNSRSMQKSAGRPITRSNR